MLEILTTGGPVRPVTTTGPVSRSAIVATGRAGGATNHLDGRFVTDVEGFSCAHGEVVNGPGGYLGWNLDAVVDWLHGRFGARKPFRLIRHDSAVAREHLVDGYDRRLPRPAVSLPYLMDLLAAEGIEIDAR